MADIRLRTAQDLSTIADLVEEPHGELFDGSSQAVDTLRMAVFNLASHLAALAGAPETPPMGAREPGKSWCEAHEEPDYCLKHLLEDTEQLVKTLRQKHGEQIATMQSTMREHHDACKRQLECERALWSKILELSKEEVDFRAALFHAGYLRGVRRAVEVADKNYVQMQLAPANFIEDLKRLEEFYADAPFCVFCHEGRACFNELDKPCARAARQVPRTGASPTAKSTT